MSYFLSNFALEEAKIVISCFFTNRLQVNVVDIIILICCVPALVQGFRKGFISQAVSLVSLVLGAWLAFKFSEPVGEWLKSFADVNGVILQVLSFSLIFLVVYLILLLLGKLAQNLVKVVMLGWLDKLLGMTFALLKMLLALGLVIICIDAINSTLSLIPSETLDDSVLYHPIKSAADVVFPYLKELIFHK